MIMVSNICIYLSCDMSPIHRVLLPGGGADTINSQYARSARLMFNLAKQVYYIIYQCNTFRLSRQLFLSPLAST